MQKTKAKLNVKVKDLMTTEVVTFKPSDKIREVAETLRAKRISGAPVVDEQG
ncbi:MAG: CBS domain-containing protein, partial [Candidatus Methanospirareceae archaeon]